MTTISREEKQEEKEEGESRFCNEKENKSGKILRKGKGRAVEWGKVNTI